MNTNSTTAYAYRPVKILHVVYSMNCGGVEAWLMHILRNIDSEKYSIDLLIHTNQVGDYAEELKELRCKIIHCCSPSKPWRYARQLRTILNDNGPYDVVHSHAVNWNGPVLSIAKQLGIPIRIAHSHNDIARSMPNNIFQKIYAYRSLQVSKRKATHGLACSDLAGSSYFGKGWLKDPRWKVLLCGENFSAFHEEVDSHTLRKSLGLPRGAYVVGHVGSFQNHQKNHDFIVSVAKEVTRIDSKIVFLLVGDGKLKPIIEDKFIEAAIKDNVFFTGVRFDVPQVMLGAMDLFLFPSLFEGLGLVMIEAQAAGLPCICSDVIPLEADVIADLITRISLTRSPEEWARVIVQLKNSREIISRDQALSIVEKSPFNISNSIKTLEAIYSGQQ